MTLKYLCNIPQYVMIIGENELVKHALYMCEYAMKSAVCQGLYKTTVSTCMFNTCVKGF